MVYKIGQKVKVRDDLIVDKQYGSVYFVNSMSYLQGKEVEIKYYGGGFYRLKEDIFNWNWTEEMFEPIEKLPENWICIVNHLNSKAQYKFKYKTSLDLKIGDYVVVDTKLGLQYAKVQTIVKNKSKVEYDFKWNRVEKWVVAKIDKDNAKIILQQDNINKLKEEINRLQEEKKNYNKEIEAKMISIVDKIKELENSL